MARLEELQVAGLLPFVVFDGADLPNKNDTNDRRRE